MDDHSANLAAAIADLKRRRHEIDTAIASMETILATVYGVGVKPHPATTITPAPASRLPRIQRSGASRAGRVRQTFADQPTIVWTAEKLATEIGEEPDEQTIKAIHGILSRLRKAGLVHKLERGEYRSTDSSGPDESGPEDDVTTTGSGGDSHALPDQDHGDDQARRLRDDRGGTPVGVLT